MEATLHQSAHISFRYICRDWLLLDSNMFAFICAGMSTVKRETGPDIIWAVYSKLYVSFEHQQQKCQWTVLETYGLSISGSASDWGKDAWSLDDGLSSQFALVLSLVHTVCVYLSWNGISSGFIRKLTLAPVLQVTLKVLVMLATTLVLPIKRDRGKVSGWVFHHALLTHWNSYTSHSFVCSQIATL